MAALTTRGSSIDESAGTDAFVFTEGAIAAGSTVIMLGWAQGDGVVSFTPSGAGLTWTVDKLTQDASGESLFIGSAPAPSGVSNSQLVQYSTDASVDVRAMAVLSIDDSAMVAQASADRLYQVSSND